MEQSILISTKKTLGISEDYTAFDLDIITHINSAFSTLAQLGVGPETGFMIQGEEEVWTDFIEDDLRYNSVKSYVFLKTRQLFDPPTTSYLIAAVEKQIEELEWRLNVHREETTYPDPNPYEPYNPQRVYIEDIHEGTVVEVRGGKRKLLGGTGTEG
jgi:hypothetical protein